MKILVTGAAGFLGSAICAELGARGVPVLGLDLRPPRAPVPSVDYVTADLRDQAALDAALSGRGLTQVIHAAALTPDAAREEADPALVLDINLLGSLRLLQGARASGITRMLLLSSIAVYGAAAPEPCGHYHEDRTRPDPQSLYGIGKHAAEQSLRRLAPPAGIALSVLRLGPIFGAHEHASDSRQVTSPHHQILMAALDGRPVVLPRAVPADWCYSRDAAAAIAGLATRDGPLPDIVHVGAGRVTDLPDWCTALAAHLPLTWQIDATTPTIRYGYPTDRPALATDRLRGLVPAPRTSLADAAAHWLDHVGHPLRPMP
ncbi:NAD-dependent epimerase/dehydratase family protein [Marinibacterium sp. SX1]|uniref:NAD-dependent epimerase/dehydratase family protein n=1 Tax=Marinibacterium sp. SX1 TaxID=3388424 RepID=UPI003D162CDC